MLRKYQSQIRAVVEVEIGREAAMMSKTGEAFRMLAGFIFGKNTKGGKSESVAMTAPVLMSLFNRFLFTSDLDDLI